MVHIYIVDATTWSLTEAPSSPLPGFTSVANFVADPTGQFVYQSTAPNQVRVYAVDLSTGYFNEVSGSPFTAAGFGLPIACSIAPGSGQPIVGPVATLTPPNLAFGNSNVGTAAPTQSLVLSSTGDQALSVNAISITGLNAGDFTELDNCNAPTVLKTTTSCLITVTFTPTASGARLAQFTVTDNAPGSPQSVALSGAGLGAPPPAPAITFAPGTLNFSAVSPGSTSLPLSVTLTNSGNAPLNISAITLSGSNPADFSAPSSNCTAAPIALGASCFLRSNREWGGSAPAIGAHASHWGIAYAMVALMILLPLLFAADGCGGGSTPAPTAQKSSVVTPSGTSTLVITPTATNASGKALQIPLIQLTLTVN